MSDREIALEALREMVQEVTTSDQVRLEAAAYLLSADEPDNESVLIDAANGVQEFDRRLRAVEEALSKRHRLRLKA